MPLLPPVPSAAVAAITAAAVSGECPNCETPLPNALPRFCHACGQETNIKPPTVSEFMQQFGGAYFATEGALWRTLRLLLFKPGELTRQYLAGRRKHYVLPLRLYLTVSLVTFLLLRLLAGGIDGAFKIDVDPQHNDFSFSIIGDHMGGGMKDGVFYCEGLPAWVCKRLQRRIDLDPKALQRQSADLGERALANLGPAMFVMLPAFALWLKLTYWSRRMRYTEHLVFALHLHAFWFLALALTFFNQNWLSAVALCAIPLYGWLALRRVYGGRMWPRVLRIALVSVLYAFTLLFVTLGVAAWTFLA